MLKLFQKTHRIGTRIRSNDLDDLDDLNDRGRNEKINFVFTNLIFFERVGHLGHLGHYVKFLEYFGRIFIIITEVSDCFVFVIL